MGDYRYGEFLGIHNLVRATLGSYAWKERAEDYFR